MAFFKLTSGKASQILPRTGGKEIDIQLVVEANLEDMFAVRFVAREFSTGIKHRGRIDTLGLDEDGSPVILEYKRLVNQTVITQGLFYLDWLLDHKGDFEIAARKATSENIDIAWEQPRLILLAEKFNRYDQYAVNRIDERIELWTYTFYEGELLRVERLDTEEVSTKKAKTPTAVAKHQKEVKDYGIDHHLAKMGEESTALFELLREQILALGDDITERFKNQYIGYRRLKNFAEIVCLKKSLNVFIDGPIKNPKNLGEDVSEIGHWGTGSLRIKISSEQDLDPVLDLITQAYELQH